MAREPASDDCSQTGKVDFDDSQHIDVSDPRLDALPMVGDVNLFLSGGLESVQSQTSPSEAQDASELDEADEFTAEAEIMIAGNTVVYYLFHAES